MDHDVTIAGAGIIGLSLALELRARGASVLVVDRGLPGQEASSAAAGMLAATDPETPAALRAMALESARIYPDFAAKLESASGISTDFRRHGTIALGEAAPPPEYRKLTLEDMRRLEPALEPGGHSAFLVAEDCVDPVLLMRAAVRAAEASGVAIMSSVAVLEIRSFGARVELVTGTGSLFAKIAVDCRGAWSGPPVQPRKGQMLYLEPSRPGLLEHVVRAPGAYIVPRSSGKILVGATVEDAGFDKSVHEDTIRSLHQAAAQYLPALGSATVTESWSGLRPGTPDGLPLLGPADKPNVFLATGHFRNGILLAPLTALIMADLVAGKAPGMDISAFSPMRFSAARASTR